jgi:hypothetical protein
MEEGYFNVKEQTLIGQPDVDPSYSAYIYMTIYGETFGIAKPVKYKFTDPVRGELYEPLVVLPSVDVSLAEDLVVLKTGVEDKKQHSILARANKKLDEVKIRLGDKMLPAGIAMTKGQQRIFELPALSAANTKTSELITLPVYTGDNGDIARSLRKIQYDHVPYIHYFKNAVSKTLVLNIETYGKKIGYIPGAGDKVPEALEQMGYEVTLLGDKELARNNLAQFDAIITGVRAYNTDEWLNNHYEKLMEYVNGGGNLIVQYNTSNNIGPVRAKIAPYSFNISRTRVTDENAAITFLKPEHQVLNFPNVITQDDFKGWVQERSIYHASDWDKEKFETIFSLNDPGERADVGSLIIAKHGKGYFTYTGIVFFRELPAGVPGAYRLLANIIALNKKKAF